MTTALDSSFFEFWIWTNHNSLLSIATNQFASFFIDIRSRQCYFRVCQSGEIWNKRAFFSCILIFLLYKTNIFHVAVRLFSNRSQRTSKRGKNISDTLGCASCATFLFLPHFDVICDLLLNRRTATWNLFVKWVTLPAYVLFFFLLSSILFHIASLCRWHCPLRTIPTPLCSPLLWVCPAISSSRRFQMMERYTWSV